MKKSSNVGLLLLLLLAVLSFSYLWNTGESPVSLEWSQVVELFENEQVESFDVDGTKLTMNLREAVDGSKTVTYELYDFDLFYDELGELVKVQADSGIITRYNYYADHSVNWLELLLPYLLIALVLGGLWFFMMGRMNGAGGGGDKMARFGAARVKTVDDRGKKVTFADVAGEDEEKEELREIVEFLKTPQKYITLGARIPKGVLLVEMDGFGSNEGVVVLAATNRADVLDPALLRPGRFDRQVFVGLPDIRGREEILRVHAKNKPLAEDVDLSVVARGTPGFTGADLENLINEAALLAARKDQPFILMEDLQEAVIKVIAGPEKRSRVIPPHERELTAYHEAGHAVVMHALPHHDPVQSISIVPRGQAGGMTISMPEEDRSYLSKSYMEEQIVSLLGGRVAEQLVLGDVSTGASNDIQRATQIARKMVASYGMSQRLGTVSFESGHDEVFIGRSMGQTRGYSEQVAAQIDEEIKALIDRAYGHCQEILEKDRDKLETVAQYLLQHETMDAPAFYAIYGEQAPESTMLPAKDEKKPDEAKSNEAKADGVESDKTADGEAKSNETKS